MTTPPATGPTGRAPDPGTRIRAHLRTETITQREWRHITDLYLDAHPGTAARSAYAVTRWYRRLAGDDLFEALHDEVRVHAIVTDRLEVLDLLTPALDAYVTAHASPGATWQLAQTTATDLLVTVRTEPVAVLKVPVGWVCAYYATAAPVAP